MPRRTPQDIPQIVAIVSLTAKKQINLKKAARQHLGLQDGHSLWLVEGPEMLLSATPSVDGTEIEVGKGYRVTLPDSALALLGIQARSTLGLVQRPNALAVKRLEIAERESAQARLYDLETPTTITRTVETNPMPEECLPLLVDGTRDLALRCNVMGFLTGRQTLPAWQARQLLDRALPSDQALRQTLIQERLEEQQADGSWAGQVALTARRLRELIDLGLTREDNAVQRAAEWLLARPQSAHNPGMFFGSDELVAEQAQVVAQRQAGKGGRFRQIKRSEQKRVIAGDNLIVAPCGPRIMWPNGLCLDALLQAGYEDHERIQAALRTLTTNEWCECGYQHGTSSWRRTEPLTKDQLAEFEAVCAAQYRYGGLSSQDALVQADLAAPTLDQYRVSHRATEAGDEYAIKMPEHTQGCEAITTRSLSHVRDPKPRRFAEAHLWRFASRQHAADGSFPAESYGSGLSQAGFLELFARYDHPVSKVVVLKALPWIVEAQNTDGSWGEQENVDATTLAVLQALLSLGDWIPAGMIQW